MGQAVGFSGVTGCNGPQAQTAVGAPQAPNAPAATPVVTPGSVQQQMASLPIPASTLRSQLNGFSLRNANTNIYADGTSHTLNTTILGQPVTITVTPVRYDFGYGDGTRKTTSTPGGPLKDDGFETPTTTGHVYKETGKYSITLTTHYAGTFSVNGGPAQAIRFTVTNTGDVTARFSAASSTTSASDLKSIMRANVGVTSGSCVASDAAAGTQTIDSYASTGVLDFAPGEKKTFCLYLSVPVGTDAALSGASLPFTLTLTSRQIQ